MTYDSCEDFLGRHYKIALALLLLATALVYSGALGNGFVWDDRDVIVNYPFNRSLDNLPQFFMSSDSISGWPATPFYRPLARASYLLDNRVFGLRPWGSHLENILLHLANVLLLFYTAQSLFKESLPPLLSASLFAVHPAISEPVFAAFARNSLMALFFSLLTFLAFQRSLRSDRFRWLTISSLCLFLGLLSKETAIAVIPVLVWYCHDERLPVKEIILRVLPFAAVFFVYIILRHNALDGTFPAVQTKSLTERMMQNVYVIPRYLLLLIAPVTLTVLHEVPARLKSLAPLLSGAWLVLAAGSAALVRYGGTVARFGFFWGICALVPVMGFVEIPGGALAERHLYVPLAGFALIWAAAASAVLRKYVAAGIGILCLITVLSMAQTALRAGDWRDDTTLFRQAAAVNPASVTAHYNLGNAYIERGDTQQAINEWMKAIRIDPNASDVLYQVGSLLLNSGRYQEAQQYLERAVAVKPSWFYAQSNLAVALDVQNRREEAAERYEQALRVIPPDRRDSIPRIRERILQLRSATQEDDKVLVRKEILP